MAEGAGIVMIGGGKAMLSVAAPLLSVRGLTIDILALGKPRRIVDRLDFDIKAGEVLAIIGESGSGKTVATRALLGLLPSPPCRVVAGSAAFEGRDLLALPTAQLRAIRGNRIGMVFQEPMSALDPMRAVGDQIADTLVAHRGLGWRAARAEAVRLLDRVRIPDAAGRAGQPPSTMSGGMRQRVVIAAAIACKPSLVIADEPTTALDATVQAEILALLKDLQQDVGCGIVIITHDMAVVRAIADRVIVLEGGRTVESGSAAAILTRPGEPYTRTLIAATSPASPLQPLPAVSTPPPVSVDDLVVTFPRRRGLTAFGPSERLFAVDGVSLAVGPGETLAVVGESGSGKTTLARALLGLVAPDRGRIRIGGRDPAAGSRANRPMVQMVFQDPQSSLDPRFRAWASITEPVALSVRLTPDDARQRAAELLARVGLDPSFLDRYPHELSGGQRQRLGIARALSVSPDLLVADEAVSALDATTRLSVLGVFRAVQAESGLPILFITHDFAVVARIAHRVAVMRFGRLVEIGPTAAILSRPAHPYTQALVAAATGTPDRSPPPAAGHRIGVLGSTDPRPALIEVTPGHFVETSSMCFGVQR